MPHGTLTTEAPTGARTMRDARFERYAKIDLEQIRVLRAQTPADFEIVRNIRAAGFGRVITDPLKQPAWIDEVDTLPGVFSLIGYDANNQPIATLRVQDERRGALELRKFVPLDDLLRPAERPVVQFARLSVIRSPQAVDAMFALFKAAWLWCRAEGLHTIVIATPSWSKPVYDFLFCEELGQDCEFVHHYAGGARHIVMKLPVQTAETLWRESNHPLSAAFLDVRHPDLAIGDLPRS